MFLKIAIGEVWDLKYINKKFFSCKKISESKKRIEKTKLPKNKKGRACEIFLRLDIFEGFENEITFICQIFGLDYKKAICHFLCKQSHHDLSSNFLPL